MKNKFLIPVAVLVFFTLFILRFDLLNAKKDFKLEHLKFRTPTQNQASVLSFIDQSLKKYGDFGVYGNFKKGLEFVLKGNQLEIWNEAEFYQVSIAPQKNEGGHDFLFRVDKKEGKISNLVVGEISPKPK